MKKNKTITENGFTIIEVSLVLAIAGLIFLMVFIALPGLRASQRDTSRRESITSFVENVKKFQNNNRGALPSPSSNIPNDKLVISYDQITGDNSPNPSSWEGFYAEYFNTDKFEDPNGDKYTLVVLECKANTVDDKCDSDDLNSLPENFSNRMYVVLHATCGGSEAIRAINPRKIAVLYRLERAGVYCLNS